MKKEQITRKDYTTLDTAYQMVLPLEFEFQIPKDDPVRLLRHFIGGMDLTELYRTYSRLEKKQASPRQMLAILVYANMNGIFSSRKIESACRRDINFMYLLEGKAAPDHATIARFRSKHLPSCIKSIFARMDAKLEEMIMKRNDGKFDVASSEKELDPAKVKKFLQFQPVDQSMNDAISNAYREVPGHQLETVKKHLNKVYGGCKFILI